MFIKLLKVEIRFVVNPEIGLGGPPLFPYTEE